MSKYSQAYLKRIESGYNRFENEQLNENSIRKAKTLTEINQALQSNYKNLASARSNRNITLRGIEEFGADITVSSRNIQFSDNTTAEYSVIEIEYPIARNEDTFQRIYSDTKKGLNQLNIDISRDIKFYIQSEYRDGKIKTVGTSLERFYTHTELINLLNQCLYDIELNYAVGIENVTIGITSI